MAKRARKSSWSKSFERAIGAMTRVTVRTSGKLLKQAVAAATARKKAPPGAGDWIAGHAFGVAGMRSYHLFRPPGLLPAEKRPLVVMLHGCGQDAKSFAVSTRMNRIAARERFFVLYPEQDRRANPQGCWNWFGTRSRGAHGEASIVLAAIDQICLFYPVDPGRIAVAGLSAGASMAALLATLYPDRFRAVVMHSGVPPGRAHSSATALVAMQGHKAPTVAPAITKAAASVPHRTRHGDDWPPLLVIHGNADTVVAPANGLAAAALWMEAAGALRGKRRDVRRGTRYPATVTDFKLKGRIVATLCEVAELGHAWSGGDAKVPYSDPRGPDASRMAWAFIAKQFKA